MIKFKTPNRIKFILLLLVFLSSFGILAQNYQTLKSNEIHYFKNDDNSILATKIDSFVSNSTDSTFYPFKTLRRTNEQLDSVVLSNIKRSDSWLGHKIIVKANGDNLFFNQYNDTIFIKTNSALNSSFSIYTYDNGNTVTGTVTNISEENILGTMDSVKTITLSSNDPSFSLNPATIKIGKTSGLISFFPFYSFPNQYNLKNNTLSQSDFKIVGQDFPKIGITKPTFHEIYDMEIGDVIQTYSYYHGDIPVIHSSQTTKQYTIIDKTFLPNDSVTYQVQTNRQYDFFGSINNDPPYTSFSSDTIQFIHNISQDYITELMPEEFNYSITTKVLYLYHTDQCNFKQTLRDDNVYPIGSSLTYYDDWHSSTTSRTYRSNALSFYYSCYDPQIGGCDFSIGYLFNTHNGQSCGAPVILGLDKKQINPQIFEVYPNPTISGFLNLKIEATQFAIQVFNQLGQPVNFQLSDQIIDLSSNPKGIYYIQISTENGQHTKKLIKL